jgi:hypothetical protein
MDWLFENLGKFAPVVIFLIYMISSLKGKGPEQEEEYDPQAAERARKIQEDIRRKILERQNESREPSGRPPQQEPTVAVEEEPRLRPEPLRRRVEAPREEPVVRKKVQEAAGEGLDGYEQQRREVEAKLEESKRLRAAAKEKSENLRKGKTPASLSPQPISETQIADRLKQSLGNRPSLKTAIVLKEVLDAPVGMR